MSLQRELNDLKGDETDINFHRQRNSGAAGLSKRARAFLDETIEAPARVQAPPRTPDLPVPTGQPTEEQRIHTTPKVPNKRGHSTPLPSPSSSSPLSSLPSMSSQRSRAGRSNPRGESSDLSAQTMYTELRTGVMQAWDDAEARARDLNKQIFALEERMKRDQDAGNKPSIATVDSLSALYREQVRITEEQKERGKELKNTLELIMAMRKTEEQSAPESTARATSSRSGMEFDGPSDSPIPSPADNRVARKFGTSRTGSLPPSRPDGTASEGSDKAKQPKIVYEKGQEVAFKRKTPGKPEEQDWIQGRVVRVIGEGKSRRYDVEDPYPDNKEENGPPPAPIIYKSSASQMVPIPPEGSDFKDYEIGRRVLALYPETTTFYRAEVKAILNDGADVQLLFEDEAAGELKIVTRRLVLDHKG